MNDLRTAAQQALEAMRCAVPTGKITLYAWDKAMSALRAALAQQAEPVEPVAWLVTTETQDGTRRTYPMTGRLKDAKDACDFGEPAPLYFAPPQRKPLTEEMEARCPYAKANPTLRGAFFDGWLNSERAHGIKE